MTINLKFRQIDNKSKSGLNEIAANISTIEAKDCICFRPPMQPRYPYTYRAIVIRLNDNSLFIISPIPLNCDIRTDLDRLGVVKYIASPNHLHHLSLGQWSQAYPEAKLYASPRLSSKRKDLNFHKILLTNTPEPEWAEEIDLCVFGSGKGWFDEIVFFHRPSKTVIFTDLIMDFDPAVFSPISRVTTRWNQMYRHTPFGIQLAHIFDRNILRDRLDKIRSWQPEHLIIAHSPWLCLDGKEEVMQFIDSAFDWLNPNSIAIEFIMNWVRLAFLLLIVLPIHLLILFVFDLIYPMFVKQSESR
ncbi:MAG: DUF4336 domain-containing protein [Prochloraceae cyanobacterium]